MFTGIIEEQSQIQTISKNGDKLTLSILAPKTASKVAIGDSVAVDGTCLTVTSKDGDSIFFDAVAETIDRGRRSRQGGSDQRPLESGRRGNRQ